VPNPKCPVCQGRGLTFVPQGSIQVQKQCTAEGCLGWTHDPTLEELCQKAEKKVVAARHALTIAEVELGELSKKLAARCITCKGAKSVDVAGRRYPCPRCADAPAACHACQGKRVVMISGEEFPCPRCKTTEPTSVA
jgi:hypothetical protein